MPVIELEEVVMNIASDEFLERMLGNGIALATYSLDPNLVGPCNSTLQCGQ
jgi:hypothetical protein